MHVLYSILPIETESNNSIRFLVYDSLLFTIDFAPGTIIANKLTASRLRAIGGDFPIRASAISPDSDNGFRVLFIEELPSPVTLTVSQFLGILLLSFFCPGVLFLLSFNFTLSFQHRVALFPIVFCPSYLYH